MIVNSLDLEICTIRDWAGQLAELTRIAWTGKDGICYFPYQPLIMESYWRTNVLAQWQNKQMFSWTLCSPTGKILSHAALVKKEENFEIGRWVSYPDSPRGSATILVEQIMRFVSENNLRIVVEATQAHASSQFICEKIGLRFAGIGFLDKQNGIDWDILYYDNLSMPHFEPIDGVLGNPLGRLTVFDKIHKKRLWEISKILTTERGGNLPPVLFHVLPSRFNAIKRIIDLNLASLG